MNEGAAAGRLDLVLSGEVAQWLPSILCERPVKIGARVTRYGRHRLFRLAEMAVPRALFAATLRRIDRLRGSAGAAV